MILGMYCVVCKRQDFVVKLKKCVLGKYRLRYLGHIVGGGTVSVPRDRIDSFRGYGRPSTKKG